MRGLSGKSDAGTFAARVVFEASQSKRPSNSPTQKLVKAIGDGMDRSSFEPGELGYLLTFLPTPVQRKFIQTIVKYVAVLSERAESGLWMDEEQRMVMLDGQQIYSALRFLDE